MHQDPGERSSDPTDTEADLPVSVWRSPAEAWVEAACRGDRRCVSFLEVTGGPTIETAHSRPGSPQAKQPTGKEHSTTH